MSNAFCSPCAEVTHLEALNLHERLLLRVVLLRVSTGNGASQQRHLLTGPNPLVRLKQPASDL